MTIRKREAKPKPTPETLFVIDWLVPFLELPTDCDESELLKTVKPLLAYFSTRMGCPIGFPAKMPTKAGVLKSRGELAGVALRDPKAGAFLRDCLINAKNMVKIASLCDDHGVTTWGNVSAWITASLGKVTMAAVWMGPGATSIINALSPCGKLGQTAAEMLFDGFQCGLVDVLAKSFASHSGKPNGAYFVGVCVTCGRGFKKDRSDMIYCSKKCQSLALIHRFRSKRNAIAKDGKKK